MKIGIIRGPYLNKWEMQNYEPLLENNSLTAFSNRSHFFSLEEIKIPVVKLFSIDSIPAMLSKRAVDLFNKLTNRLLGSNYYLYGLEQQLRDMDVIHTMELFHTFTNQAIEAKKKYGNKVIVFVWEDIPFSYEKNIRRIRNKKNVIKNADLFIVPAKKIKETLQLEGAPSDKIRVLPLGVDLQRFKPLPRALNIIDSIGFKKEDKILLFIGRFVREKGVFDLIYAAKKLKEEKGIKHNIKVLFVGNGPQRMNMIKIINKLGMQNDIKLIARLPYNEIPGLLSISDIFVLPSIPTRYWNEQFGMVLVEAMACGKPIVSTYCGSIPEVLGDAGLLAVPGDYVSLAEQLKKIITDELFMKELGEKGRKRALEIYDAKKVSLKLEEYSKQAIGKGL